MSIIKFLAAGSVQFAQFVTANSQSGASMSAISYAGATAGKLCVIMTTCPSAGLSAAGYSSVQTYTFTSPGGADTINVIYKVLTAGDISTGSVTPTYGGGFQGTVAMFYAGGSVATIKSSNDVVAGAVTLPGFTKNAASKAIITFASDRSGGSLVKPAAFTSRVASFLWSGGTAAAADLTSTSYTNGTSETWTGGGGTNPFGGVMIELT